MKTWNRLVLAVLFQQGQQLLNADTHQRGRSTRRLIQNSGSFLNVFLHKRERFFDIRWKRQSLPDPQRKSVATVATAKVQIRHLDLQGLRMLLIDVGEARPFEVDLQRLRIHLRMVQEDIGRMRTVN